MGIFNNWFGKQDNDDSTNNSGLPWQLLESADQFRNLLKNSALVPKVIFKHSTRCGISRMALKSFEDGYTLNSDQASFYLLDLLNHRELSNLIASELNVMHQSPQVIVIINNEIVYTDSHHGIDIHKVEQLIT